ncbi:hypothetical protein M0Q97_08160 [Candidatus Dojkabacteria bacterium]|jgi:hypothetical protein|nr:hypothetical protein [Candidatus Dojkabacteria bacterium]
MTKNELIKNIKNVFKLPKKRYYLGKLNFGTPYFYPCYFNQNIISIRKLNIKTKEELELYYERYPHQKKNADSIYSNMPMCRRSKDWIIKIFNIPFWIQIGWPISIVNYGLGWKDKYECYDEETEVLTKNGWKFFKDLNYDDLIICLNNKNQAEYHHPLNLTSYDYSGKMYRLHSTGVSLMVTPNHKLYVAKGNQFGYGSNNITVKRDFELCTPDKYFRKPKRFLKSFEWVGNSLDYFEIPEYKYFKKIRRLDSKSEYTIPRQIYEIKQFLKFLGFFTAEGCANENKGDIFISVCNDGSDKATNEQNDIEEVLLSLGFKIKKTHKNRTAIGYIICNKPLAIWLVENCGKLAPNKKTPNFIKDLTPELINIYLTWLYKGDGHKTKTSNILTTVSHKLKDDVEDLILKGGKTFYSFSTNNINKQTKINKRIITSKHIAYHINWLQHRNDLNISTKTINTSKNYTEEWVDYTGKVYCATVPFGKLFIKKDGKSVWCGNSPRYEWQPSFQIYFFKWQFCIFWDSPDGDNDNYYEMILWYLEYSKKDIKKAEETWDWVDSDTKKSTWNNDYLI